MGPEDEVIVPGFRGEERLRPAERGRDADELIPGLVVLPYRSVVVGIPLRPVFSAPIGGVEAIPDFPGLGQAIPVRIRIAGVRLPGARAGVPGAGIHDAVAIDILPLPRLPDAVGPVEDVGVGEIT